MDDFFKMTPKQVQDAQETVAERYGISHEEYQRQLEAEKNCGKLIDPGSFVQQLLSSRDSS